MRALRYPLSRATHILGLFGAVVPGVSLSGTPTPSLIMPLSLAITFGCGLTSTFSPTPDLFKLSFIRYPKDSEPGLFSLLLWSSLGSVLEAEAEAWLMMTC